jgi:fructose-specific phosphotransferase system IIC component
VLLPLIGFIASIFVSSAIGAIIISIHPRWKLNSRNLVLFIIGSFLFAVIFSLLYTKVIADASGTLHSAVEIYGYFGALIAAVLIGGTSAVYFGRKLLKFPR